MNARVTWSMEGAVAEIVLSTPERLNAMDLEMVTELRDAVRAIAAYDDAERRVVTIRAEGRHFCVGGDLRAFDQQGDAVGEYVREVTVVVHEALELIQALRVPVVTSVHGAVAGAGVGLALAGDLVVLADSASFKLAYTAVGLSPDNGSSYLLPRMLGERRALELMLTNRSLSAQDALALGLATQVVPADALQEATAELVQTLLGLSPASAVATKQLVRASLGSTLAEQLVRETESISTLVMTPPAREALRTFGQR